MRKSKLNRQPDSLATAASIAPAVPLSQSASAAALKLINTLELEAAGRLGDGQPASGAAKATGRAAPSTQSLELDALKARCAAFGIDATTAELLSAGLHLLAQQTETALEVAMLQSLRADRTFVRRRSKR